MSTLESRGWDHDDAVAFRLRAHNPHTVEWKANCLRWVGGGGEDVLLDDMPIVGGTLTLDASDPIRRRLTLNLGNAPVPKDYLDPLVPFGQFIRAYMRIDLPDGSWSPWLKQFEGPIKSHVLERPSMAATVECTDYSGTVNEFLYLAGHSYKGRTLASAVQEIVNDALPDRVASTDPDHIWDHARTAKIASFVGSAGSGRWDAATEMCTAHDAETFFDWNGDLVIRRALADADGITGPSNGPDIGDRDHPVSTIGDGPTGSMIAMTATVTREGGCNLARIILHPTATEKGRKHHPPPPEYRTHFVTAEVTSGPAKWGDIFGRLPIVISKDVFKATPDVITYWQGRANQIKYRRRGVVRFIDMDCVGQYWLEPDDVVEIAWRDYENSLNRTETHFVAAVTFDLSGRSPTRVTTRELAVEDPGA